MSSRNSLEIAFAVSNSEGLDVWDVNTGICIKSFSFPVENFGLIGDSHFVISQSDKPGLQVWSWVSGTSVYKCAATEKISSFAATSDGVYLAGGSPSGKIYIWNLLSGTLVRVFDAHFKKVTCLVFSDDNSMLYSGGDDAIVNSWLFMSLLQSNSQSASSMSTLTNSKPFSSFSSHSLSISSIYIGLNTLLTCSIDRTVRLFDLNANVQVACILLPVAAHSAVMDILESRVYVAALDGKIYRYDLSKVSRISKQIEDLNTHSDPPLIFLGHSKPVQSIALNFDNTLLISASLDGNCIVWDVESGQVLRTLKKQRKSLSHIRLFQDFGGFFGVKKENKLIPAILKKFPNSSNDDLCVVPFVGRCSEEPERINAVKRRRISTFDGTTLKTNNDSKPAILTESFIAFSE